MARHTCTCEKTTGQAHKSDCPSKPTSWTIRQMLEQNCRDKFDEIINHVSGENFEACVMFIEMLAVLESMKNKVK